jgi:mutator protein MutT
VSRREYPDRPFVGVGAVIVDGDRVVLVRRAVPPLQGEWSLPGGAVEVGETLEACVVREMAEETGLAVEVGPVIEVLDRIVHDASGRVQFHYVLVDYLCWPIGGELRAATDVDDVALVAAAELPRYSLAETATAVIARAFELARNMPADVPRAVR